MVENKYEWRLTWCSQKDGPMLRAAFEKCKEFPLFKDSGARLISHEEYVEMIEKGEIAPAVSYWCVREGEVGLISKSYCQQYSNTWDKISCCEGDFEDGWRACEKFMNSQIR
jgi:hypothetical protein